VAGVLVVVLGLVRIGRGYGYDEAVTVAEFVRTGSPLEAFTTQVVFNNHPLFSAIQAVTWRLGLTTEVGQRLTPALFGAMAIAITTWFAARRWGLAAAATVMLSLSSSPMVLGQVRSVRGYSLAMLGVVVAGIALHRSLTDRRHRWLVVQGVAMAVAVATHLYAAVPLLILAAAVMAAGRLERRLVATWVAAAGVTVLALEPILDDTFRVGEERGRRFRAGFPVELGLDLLGGHLVPAAIAGALAVIGGVAIARTSLVARRAVMAGLGVFVVVVLAVWLIARPVDLYPRFFLAVAPLAALLAARGAAALPGRWSPAAPVVLGLALLPGALVEVRRETPVLPAARIVDTAADLGLETCVRNALALRAYTEAPRRPVGADAVASRFEGCDLVISLGEPPAAFDAAARTRFAEFWDGPSGLVVYADDILLVVGEPPTPPGP
jgi:hypothetical protein